MALTAGSPAPSAAQVRSGSDSRRRQLLELRSSGSTVVAANVPTAMIANNLIMGDAYEIYFTVAGADGYVQVSLCPCELTASGVGAAGLVEGGVGNSAPFGFETRLPPSSF
jgi:hypothetical protein